MPAPHLASYPVADRVAAELRLIRTKVTGVHGSIAATSDGLLVASDVPDLEPAEVAALVATTHALASRTTLATGRGQFRETVTRGSHGYLAVYAAGSSAIVAVIGTTRLNVGMLQYQARDIIERVASYSAEFTRWGGAAPSRGGPSQPRGHREADRGSPRALPKRRRPS